MTVRRERRQDTLRSEILLWGSLYLEQVLVSLLLTRHFSSCAQLLDTNHCPLHDSLKNCIVSGQMRTACGHLIHSRSRSVSSTLRTWTISPTSWQRARGTIPRDTNESFLALNTVMKCNAHPFANASNPRSGMFPMRRDHARFGLFAHLRALHLRTSHSSLDFNQQKRLKSWFFIYRSYAPSHSRFLRRWRTICEDRLSWRRKLV